MAAPPTLSQQRALAYAPKPFAALSFLASGYVIYHLLRQPQKRKRMYHRLVLAMNVSVVPHSFAYFWGTWAVPEGTEYFVGASGNVNTCTAQGFIMLVFSLAVPTYYASLSTHSYVAIKNNYNEEKYKWIEMATHFVAYSIPLALASAVAATQNINPNGSGCFISAMPRGCMNNPDVNCERGGGYVKIFTYIFAFCQILVYFVIPPIALFFTIHLIRRARKEIETSRGMQAVREAARRKMLHNVALQIGVYLFSFWFTYIFNVAHFIYRNVTGGMLYNLLIFGNCIVASQGCIISCVYFTLQRATQSNQRRRATVGSTDHEARNKQLTVSTIRANAEFKDCNVPEVDDGDDERQMFSIFDGTPDQNSPWAMYLDPDPDDSGEEDS